MTKRVAGTTPSTATRRGARLCLAAGAALLSVAFAQAQGLKSAGDGAKAQGDSARGGAEARSAPGAVDGRPFVELAERGRMMVESGRLGFDTTLDFAATAELAEDGSFKPETLKVEWRQAGDEDVVEFARHLLAAVGRSRALAVLKDSAKIVRLTARLDRENLALGLESEFASEAEAAKWAHGYGALLAVARKAKEGTGEGRLYGAVQVASEGRAVRVAFEMPKVFAAKMVAEMLDRRAARGAGPDRD